MIYSIQFIFTKSFEFWQKNGGLKCIQSGIPADTYIVVLKRAFSMNTDGFQIGSCFIIIDKNSAPISVTS